MFASDETWIHSYDPLTKIKRDDISRHARKKSRCGLLQAKSRLPSSGTVREAELMDRDATVSAERYWQTLKKLKQRIGRVQPNRKMNQVLHDHARPHTSPRTRKAFITVGWIVLPHPPSRPNLAPLDCHLIGPLNDTLRGRHFADNGLKRRV
jgi:hypothetical protein